MSKRKGINSRSKGIRFEQECSRLWAEVMGHPFRRTRGSGAGIICGDIAPYSENQEEVMKWIKEFPFTIEAKNNEYLEIHHIITNIETSFVWKSWLQAVDNAQRAEKIPFLMMTKNNFPTLCMVDWSGWGTIVDIFSNKFNIDLLENIIFTFYDSVLGTNTTYYIFEWQKIGERNE